MSLNDAILTTSGGSWDNPPPEVEWLAQQAEERDSIIRAFASSPAQLWGFKDPRTLLTLPFWQDGLPDLKLVGTFRHPVPVARSLEFRDRMPRDHALRLWRIYNLKLLACLQMLEFPVVAFDVPPEEYQDSVERAATYLGIAGGNGGHGEGPFFEASLRHHTLAEGYGPVPDECAWLYDILNQIYEGQCKS
jgi:hypothetical protein